MLTFIIQCSRQRVRVSICRFTGFPLFSMFRYQLSLRADTVRLLWTYIGYIFLKVWTTYLMHKGGPVNKNKRIGLVTAWETMIIYLEKYLQSFLWNVGKQYVSSLRCVFMQESQQQGPVQSPFSHLSESLAALKRGSLLAPHYEGSLWRIVTALTSFTEETFSNFLI